MKPAFLVEILTPKKVLLNGLWLGRKNAKKVIVWVHGLGSSMFSKLELADALVDKDTAVLAFNNRGHDKISRLVVDGKKNNKAGAAHEVFEDCVDDIQGAINFAKRNGAKIVFLAGHSTGCQKSIYWASKKGTGVKGVIILAPVSDYSAELKEQGPAALKKAEKVARRMVEAGKKHTLLPEDVWSWPWIADAQRFLSLYSGRSAEEIFTYWDPKRSASTLRSVKPPVLVLLAENDEYADRPAAEIYEWFLQHLYEGEVEIIRKAAHGFKGAEKKVANSIRRFALARS